VFVLEEYGKRFTDSVTLRSRRRHCYSVLPSLSVFLVLFVSVDIVYA